MHKDAITSLSKVPVGLLKKLTNKPQVIELLNNHLGFDKAESKSLAPRIADEERICEMYKDDATVERFQKNNIRDPECRIGYKRLRLYADIVQQLVTKPRPDDDEEIKLGFGGGVCDSRKKVARDRQAYLVVGGPGSGKSTIARLLARRTASVIVDPDDAKKCLPESEMWPAQLIHQESRRITYGAEGVLDCLVSEEKNVVIPTVGSQLKSLDALRKLFTGFGYSVHIVLVQCGVFECARRVVTRFRDTGRYVPLEYVCVKVNNRPSINYWANRHRKHHWLSFSAYSSEVWPAAVLELGEGAVDLGVDLARGSGTG